jgi:hypothetical protein
MGIVTRCVTRGCSRKPGMYKLSGGSDNGQASFFGD